MLKTLRFATLVLFVSISLTANAQEKLQQSTHWREGWHADLGAGSVFMLTDDAPGLDKMFNLDTAFYFPLNEKVSAGLNMPTVVGDSRFQSGTTQTDTNFSFGLLPSFQYTFLPHHRFAPYIKAGFGWAFGTWDDHGLIFSGIMLSSGGGVELHISRHFSLFVETKLDCWIVPGTDLLQWKQTLGLRIGSLAF